MAQRQFCCQPAQQKIALDVVDEGKVLPQSHEVAVGSQQFGTKRVERADGRGDALGVQYRLQAFLHLSGSLT